MVGIRRGTLNVIKQAIHLKKSFLTLEFSKKDLGFFIALQEGRFLRGFSFFDPKGTGLNLKKKYIKLYFRYDHYGHLLFQKFLINSNFTKRGIVSSKFILQSNPITPLYFIRTKYGIKTQKPCMLLGCGGILLLQVY